MSPREFGNSSPSEETKDYRSFWEKVSDGVAAELHIAPEGEQVEKYIEAKAQLLALEERYQKEHGKKNWRKDFLGVDISDIQGADYRVTAIEQLLVNKKDELTSEQVQQAIEKRKSEIFEEERSKE